MRECAYNASLINTIKSNKLKFITECSELRCNIYLSIRKFDMYTQQKIQGFAVHNFAESNQNHAARQVDSIVKEITVYPKVMWDFQFLADLRNNKNSTIFFKSNLSIIYLILLLRYYNWLVTLGPGLLDGYISPKRRYYHFNIQVTGINIYAINK
uniref:Uncharacterized protein n=1 Tax=Rhizophagus irregularis (strain DAOM 181602 / DAOM 197198 / MUCL 43194) TaxID=747089 RepID=U9SLQ0_RHIID